jgi:cell division protein FtsL
VTPAAEAAPVSGRPEASPRPKFTSRAAVLVVVICAIGLSLAYPIREYIAERRQIDQLQAENAQLASRVQRLRTEQQAATSPTAIEQFARENLGMCFPAQTCYVVLTPARKATKTSRSQPVAPWYGTLWASVRGADKAPAR